MGKATPESISLLRQQLQDFAQGDSLDILLAAIRSSYLTAGAAPMELSDFHANILRPLVGWPSLSDKGRAIGRDLVDHALLTNVQHIQEALGVCPDSISLLFIKAANKGQEIYSLRIPEDPEGFDQLHYRSSLTDLLGHEAILHHIVKLTDGLAERGLAERFSGRAYRGAKWTAIFFYVPSPLIRTASDILVARGASLSTSETLFERYKTLRDLLRSSTLPTLAEFQKNGVPREQLDSLMKDSVSANIISRFSRSPDTGPAFLVLERGRYGDKVNQILRPMFDEVIGSLTLQQNVAGGGRKGAGRKPDPAPPVVPPTTPPTGEDSVVIGSEKLGPQWGLLGKSGARPVVLDLNAPHTIFVCGKMGSGKGYTIGVICEMLAGGSVPNLCHVPKKATIIVLYAPSENVCSEFWSIIHENDSPSEVSALKDGYGLKPRKLVQDDHLKVFVDPEVFRYRSDEFRKDYGVTGVYPIHLDPSVLRGDDWALVLATGGKSDALYVKQLFKLIERLAIDPKRAFTLDALKHAIDGSSLNESRKTLARERIGLLSNYTTPGPSGDVLRNLAIGGINIFDLRYIVKSPDDKFSVLTLIMSVLQAKPSLEKEHFVFVINEAHSYFDRSISEDFIKSMQNMVRRERHGANWLILDTHFPEDVTDRIIALSDIKVVHFMDRTINSAILGKAFGIDAQRFSTLGKGEAYVSADISSEGKSRALAISIRPRITRHGGATKTAL